MKSINQYILEKFRISKNTSLEKSYIPESRIELLYAINDVIRNSKKKRDINFNSIDTSKIKDMKGLFNSVNKITPIYKINISDWDVSNVTDMSNIFSGCEHLETDVSSWNTKNVTNMQGAFFNCPKFNSKFDNWKVDKCTNFIAMFAGCKSLDTDLSHWDLTDIDRSKMKWMFNQCNKMTNTQKPVGFKN